MSASSQNSGKKSSNISVNNTPVSTPVTNTTNGNSQAATQSTPPPNNAPKYGTLVPNRIFVGGISANTTEGELLQLFSTYGTVKAAKIIQDRAGVSKGYGFITFETEDDAKRPLRDSESIVLRERKLNIAPAIKKQPFNRAFDGSSPPTVAPGNPQYFFTPGTVPYFQGGVAYYPQPPAPPAPGDPSAQPATVYQPPPVYPPQTAPPQAASYPSVMFPTQTIYMPQQYPMAMPYDYNYYPGNGGGGPAQYVVGGQGGAQGGPPLQQPPSASSPPRAAPACYGSQQLAYAAAPEPMFYGVPTMYGPMDAAPTAIYTDCVDLANSGYAEDQCVEYEVHTSSTTTTATSAGMMPDGGPRPLPPSLLNSVEHTDCSVPPPPTQVHPPALEQQPLSLPPPPPPPNTVTDTTRQSNTPVVSLLSIEQQQERDYVSMQSGRRRKSAPSMGNVNTFSNGYGAYGGANMNMNMNMSMFPPQGSSSYHHHHHHQQQQQQPQASGFHNMYASFTSMPPPPPPPPMPSASAQSFGQQDQFNRYQNRSAATNGYDRNRKRRPYNASSERRMSENMSSRGGMRTGSGSPASVPEDVKGEEPVVTLLQHNRGGHGPSSSTYNSYHSSNANAPHHNRGSGARNPRNSYGRVVHNTYTNTNYSERRAYNRNNNNNNNNTKAPNSNNPSEAQQHEQVVAGPSSSTSNVRTDTESSSNFNRVSNTGACSSSQVHAGNQSFVPPARRNRRSVRKGGNGSSSLNEIGAGDAPLPSQEVGEACKRIESLKL